jgi:Domain of unknown function (DUF4149)
MARLQVFLAALWWGSLCAVGFMVVPMLFLHLETPAIAGQMAAKLFTAQSWLSLVCGLLLLLAAKRLSQDESHTQSPWVIVGMLCALFIEVTVKPHIVAHDNMMLWHNLGTALYLAQWLCAGKTLWNVCSTQSELAVAASSTSQD